MTDYTTDHRLSLEAYLATHTLPKGIGNEESACTLAAINLAMSGGLTDDIPACMSEVLGKAAIALQDFMPDGMRNSPRYKRLIPDMPGTGRVQEQEQERLSVLLDWMWSVVLPYIQPIEDNGGFGGEWRRMCQDRTAAAADAAAYAAARAADAAAAYAAARAADAAARAARAAARATAHAYAARAAADAAAADAAAAYAAARAADAAAYAADASADAAAVDVDVDADTAARAAALAAYAARADFWAAVDPIGVLERMTYLTGGKP